MSRLSIARAPPGSSTDCTLLRVLFQSVLLVWLLLPVATHAQSADAAGVLRLARAEFVISDSAMPPADGWQARALPVSWLHDHAGFTGVIWYRMRFVLDEPPPQAMALYVGRISLIGQFWLNGLILNPQDRFFPPDGALTHGMGRWPHLLPLPAGLLRTGENVLHIRLQANSAGGRGLWDVRIGRIEDLRGPWLVRAIPERIVPQALFILMVAGSVFALVVWRRAPRAESLQFTVLMLLWTLVVGTWIAPQPALPRIGSHVYVGLFLMLLYIAFFWLLLALLYRYSESEWRWYPRLLHVVSGLACIAAVGITLFDPVLSNASQWMGLVIFATVALRLVATAMLLQASWRRRSPRIYALTAAELLWFSGHVQIGGIVAGWLPPTPFRFDPAFSLPLYLVLLYFFADRLVREREQAVRDRQIAITSERARILHDMHDGMGSQLIAALRLARRKDADPAGVAAGIEQALEDLRLIIDSLDVGDQGLVSLLGNLRYRLEPQLSALGMRLQWDIEPLPELESATPEFALGVLRIVQEALNNAVKHAQATRIAVSLNSQRGAVVVVIADSGIGFEPGSLYRRGRGLSNMQRRAEQLGATLRIGRADQGGSVVTLSLPPVLRAPQVAAV